MQHVLHNVKMAISRACSVVGRVLPPADANLPFQYLVTVAKRYGITKLPVDSRQHRSLLGRRFRTGVSLTGREVRSLASRLAQNVALPLPYHVLFLSICHIVILICSGTLQIPTSEWRIRGLLHVFVMHLILEYNEEGSTQTLYCHGMEHIFQLPWSPMGCTNEEEERDLRLGKRFAHLISTVADKSIKETLGHEMYVKFLGRRARRCEVHLWHRERRGVVLEQCAVSASPIWRVVFERLLAKILDNNTFRCYMHMSTQSVYITTDTCKPQTDVYCICGRCGPERSGQRRWTLATMVAVRQWPTFNYASGNPYLTKKQRKQLAKEQAKGKAVVGKHSTTREQGTKVTVVTNRAEDSAASFDIGLVSDSATQWTQPMHAAKPHRRIVVDANNSFDPDPTASDSCGNSSMASSDASSHTDSGDSTSTGTPSTTSSNNSSDSLVLAAPPPKTFRRCGVPNKLAVKVECIDVDDASSSAPPATLLRESDHYPTGHVAR